MTILIIGLMVFLLVAGGWYLVSIARRLASVRDEEKRREVFRAVGVALVTAATVGLIGTFGAAVGSKLDSGVIICLVLATFLVCEIGAWFIIVGLSKEGA